MENKIECLLDMIPQQSHFYYYFRGCWANGKEGTITDSNGHGVYRFYPIIKDANGNRIDDEINYNDYVTNPVVATGIIGYWLHYRKNNDRLASFTTWTKEDERKNILKIFTDYTEDKLKQYIEREQYSASSWRRDLKKEFYTDFIIPNEKILNENTKPLMEYITTFDQQQVKEVMEEYMLFLENRKKAYEHSTSGQELSQNTGNVSTINPVTNKEEIEDLDKEGEKLEKRVEDRNKENQKQVVTDIDNVEKEIKKTSLSWDDSFDFIFNKKVKPQEIYNALKDAIPDTKLLGRPQYYVSFRILKILKYVKSDTTVKDYLKWINLHFNYEWSSDNDLKFRINNKKEFDKLHPSKWKNINTKSDIEESYYNYAIALKNVFTQTIENGKKVDDSESYEHLKDRPRFLCNAFQVDGDQYFAKDKEYINNGK